MSDARNRSGVLRHGTLAQLRQIPRDLARWQHAQQQSLAGQAGAALSAYRDLLRRYPAAAELWFELGNAASQELDFARANEAYGRAIELAQGDAALLVMIGQQYQSLRQLDRARACFERALVADPASVDARISLAVCFEKERRLNEAWECVETCLARNPRDDQGRYFRAFLLHRKGQNVEAEGALRELIRDVPKYPYVQYASRHLLGVVLDQLGQYREALRWLCESKAQVRQLIDTAQLEIGYDNGDRNRRELLSRLTPERFRLWCEAPHPHTSAWRPAFLGGHPRSGTTLIEQILDAHPEVLAFDEPGAFNSEIAGRLVPPQTTAGPALAALDKLSATRRADLRQRYERSLRREISDDAKARVWLDKNPSPTAALHLWLRVFPELKVIIALRDPRDVVISCFFLNIMLNATNVNFLSLERTARHYADLMDVWLRLREWGGFDWIETRYEDVVANLEAQGRRVTEFLGLSWHPSQARYYENSRRKFLSAPTYHDVTQPVYTRSVGRWERYAEALEPILPRLVPYCQAFGYSS